MEGTSIHARITKSGRGTQSYRAPELLREWDKREYTNKVDIWAVGCILVELVLQDKAFNNDFEVQKIADPSDPTQFKTPFDRIHSLNIDPRSKSVLLAMIKGMLRVNHWERPTADALWELLDSLENITSDILLSNCQHTLIPKTHKTLAAVGPIAAIASGESFSLFALF
jgi:serine/threonine protein kinase